MRVVGKVVLMLVIFGMALLPTIGMIVLLFYEQQAFEFSMLIPFGLTALGLCSTLFHAKTISFYKAIQQDIMLPKPNNLLLGLNLGFATVLLLVTLLFIYVVFLQNPFELSDSDIPQAIFFIGLPGLLGIILFLEFFYIKRKLNLNKEKEVLYEIENIKGNSDRH